MNFPSKLKITIRMRQWLRSSRKPLPFTSMPATTAAIILSIAILVVAGITTRQTTSTKGTLSRTSAVSSKTYGGRLINSPTASSQPSGSPSPTGSQPLSSSAAQVSVAGKSASGSSINSNSPAPYLIMSPNAIVLGDNSSPHLSISNRTEISKPADDYTSSPDLALGWFDDGQGHYAPGDYYLGWKPLIMRKNTDHDGQQVFNITVNDRAGKSYSTTFKIVYFANRNLQMQAGSLDKSVDGSNVVYTGHLIFSPTPNFGNPIIRLTSSGFYNFDYSPCSLSHTDSTFTYTGQTGYDITCSLPQSNLNGYQGGFDIYVNAQVAWPIQTATNFSTKFHAN